MDPNTGQIYQVKTPQDRAELEKRLGVQLIPLTHEQAKKVKRMSYAKRLGFAKHWLAARDSEETPEEHRKVKNSLKAIRRKRRGK